jgi:cyanophycin synthetase
VRASLGLVAFLRRERAGKLFVVTGCAGDRGALEIADVIGAITDRAPDRVWVRELEAYLRGRSPGELPEVFRAGFLARGLPADAFTIASGEVDALEQAFAVARPGDFIALLVHVEHAAVGAFLGERGFTRFTG